MSKTHLCTQCGSVWETPWCHDCDQMTDETVDVAGVPRRVSVHDPDLSPLLERCTNEDLDPLVQYVLKAATNTLDNNENYKANAGNHRAYVEELVKEIREFGGNSFLNPFRDAGVPYSAVVRDVAGKLSVDFEKQNTVEQIEMKILGKICEDSIKKMSPRERADLEAEFKTAGFENVDLSVGLPAGFIAAQLGIKMTGFLAYKVAVIVANAVARAVLGRGLSLAANATLTRVVGIFAGPIGWAVTGAWTAIDVAGPAYRVTIPVVCHTAYLRMKKKYEALGTL